MRIDHDDGVSFITSRLTPGGVREIVDIKVMSERRKGLGRSLVERVIKNAAPGTNVVAMTRRSNEIAQAFWSGIGFRKLGELSGFYGDTGEDAIVYGKRVE